MNQIFCEDCLVGMKSISDKTIDMILTDLPYGTTQNKWDSVIPFDRLWEQYGRVIKNNGAIVLFCQQPFTTKLIESNLEMFRYEWIWDKILTTGFLNANRMPLRVHEDIAVFYKELPKYNPQYEVGKPSHSKGTAHKNKDVRNCNYGRYESIDEKEDSTKKCPRTIIRFQKPHPSISVHPTQKPVELCEYLIRTYTDLGDVVLDSCMGSGTTGIACVNTERNFIGFETSEDYFEIAKKRIKDAETVIQNKSKQQSITDFSIAEEGSE